MNAFLAYLVTNASRVFAVATLRVLISLEAIRVYGCLLILFGVLFGNVALAILGGAMLYYTRQQEEEKPIVK